MTQITREARLRIEEWVRKHYRRLSLAGTPFMQVMAEHELGWRAVLSAASRHEAELKRHSLMPPVRWVGAKATPPATPGDVDTARRMAAKMLAELRPWYSEAELPAAFARLCEQRKRFALTDSDARGIVAGVPPAKGRKACRSKG